MKSTAAELPAMGVADLGPQPCASIRAVDEATAELQTFRLFVFPDAWNAMLAESLTPEQSNWLVNGLAVLGLLVGIGVGLKNLIGKKGQSTQLEGQPIGVTGVHPCVEKPDHERHMTEIWTNMNGLRSAVAAIETSVARVATAREDNGRRLDTIEHEMTALAKRCAALGASLEGLNQSFHALDSKLEKLRDKSRN